MITKNLLPILMGALLPAAAFAQPDSLRWNEFKPRLLTDFGHVVKGEYIGKELSFQPLNRNIVVLEQSASLDPWAFDVGFKAIIWWPFKIDASQPHERNIRVEPRLSQVRVRRSLGDDDYADFGFFPHKYNRDARNLGEYLYRSGTYPGVIRSTDGFHLMNHSVYEATGIHARWSQLGGRVRHDFNLFTERTSIPIGDLTPGYELSFSLPAAEIGLGAAYNRLVSYDNKRVRPRVEDNALYRVDSAGGGGAEFIGPVSLLPNNSPVRARITGNDSTVHVLHYYTQRGLKLMARASLDLGFLLPEESRNPGDLRCFAEAALLGWENQPYFFEDRSRRMPVMIGMNVPTFRLLDLLSIQAEYYKSLFSNSYQYSYFAYPVWTVNPTYNPARENRDDWKWSVNARKSVNRIFTLHAQVASDHLSLTEFNLNPSSTSLTQSPSQWYYLLRMECGL
jgi:hypothetical protein